MITYKFTMLDLTDLALRVPEIGAVNFNILHAVLSSLIIELGLDNVKIPCNIEDEVLAQTAITKNRMSNPKGTRKPSKIHTVQEIKEKVARLEEDTLEPSQEEVALKPSEEEVISESSQKEVTIEPPLEEVSLEPSKEKDTTDDNRNAEAEDLEETTSHKESSQIDETINQDENIAERTAVVEELIKKVDTVEFTETHTENEIELATATEEKDETISDATAADEEAAEITLSDAMEVLLDEIEEDPTKVLEEMWRATNINRRMEAAEVGLRELSSIIDLTLDKVQDMEEQSEEMFRKSRELFEEMGKFIERMKSIEDTCKTLALRIDDCNEKREEEVNRLEEITEEMKNDQHETKEVLALLEAKHDDLAEKAAYKEEMREMQAEMSEELEVKMKEIKNLIWEIEETLVKKESFAELIARVETLEDIKVNRDELGKLLEPGFIDNFLEEQKYLRDELEMLKERVTELEINLENLKKMIEEDVIKVMEEKFAGVYSTLNTMKEKLDLLDPDEINDSFANLEEQAVMIMKELEELKMSVEHFQKEARINFNKISNFNEILTRLEQMKVDKSKLYELLEAKADIDLLMNKLDRSEFVSVVGDMNVTLERLTITVKINEEEMQKQFTVTQQDLTLKMYTEDFITATQPIRNRIKAIIYELESVKQISLTHLFPDAPGITKCISCKRGAHMAGPKFLGDVDDQLLQEVPPRQQDVNLRSKLPPVDLEKVPIPSPDKEREKDALRLPVLFATARPQIGLVHEKRRSEIDKELATYFASKPVRPIDGEYTRTMPQQRGVTFSAVMYPFAEKEEVLLEGVNKNIYKGKIYEKDIEDVVAENLQQREKEPEKQERDGRLDDIKSLKEPRVKKGFIKPIIKPRRKSSDLRDTVEPTVVRFHSTMSPSVVSHNTTFPTPYIEKVQKIFEKE